MANFPGVLYVISAPSGAGKTTLVKALLETQKNITVSISHTTRPKRSNELHGTHYFFVSDHEFQEMAKANAFIEYAHIFGHYYGTSHLAVEEMLNQGIDVILEIDWQGYHQIKKQFQHAIGIFILPPSLPDLKERLVQRAQDKLDDIHIRLQDVKDAVSHIAEYEYVVMNNHFDRALHDLSSIVRTQRLKKHKQLAKYKELVQELTDLRVE